MQETSLKARCARIYKYTAHNRFYAAIGNKINNLEATWPDQIWVGDVTYLRVNKEWRYLAVIMDKFSRRIIGWSLSIKRDVALSITAFKRAASKRLVESGLYFHSDRGSEYIAEKYRMWLKKHGVIQSLNRKRKINDNAENGVFLSSV